MLEQWREGRETMCGIFGYCGPRHPLAELLIEGLRRLEYRGYDSAGLAVRTPDGVRVVKSVGPVRHLEARLREEGWDARGASDWGVGIAHTRWATHGPPTEANAHPHSDVRHRIFLVHNGILDNYEAHKGRLMARGVRFESETDTEVLANLIGERYERDLAQAVAAALREVTGTFGLAVISAEEPDRLVVARRGSPIVLGIGDGETLVASDVTPILPFTNRVIYLEDNEVAEISPRGVEIRNLDNIPVRRDMHQVEWSVDAAEKGGYAHFMLKEIFEQPRAIEDTVRGRLDWERASARLDGLKLTPREMAAFSRIILTACGTSLHAAMVGEYYLEDLAGRPVEVAQAAEFRYRNPIIERDTLVVAISQSGETADTLAAVREAQNKGAVVASICNVVGSTIARETGRGIYLHAGPEISVASTKAFSCQVAVLLLLALKFGRMNRLSPSAGEAILREVERLPARVQEVLDGAEAIREVAERYATARDFFYIGRGLLYPVALEGALKLKEISYIHAEGYHAAELKHGPLALLEESVPVLALAPRTPGYERMLANIQECRARGAPVIALRTRGDEEVGRVADAVLEIPECSEWAYPIVATVALQLLAYYAARARGCPIDQPRHLAKSVTVE